jgi:uncharacterized protein (DUF4415 family)
MKIKKGKNKFELTKEDLNQLELAKKMPIVYDEDSPRLTKKMLKEFKHYSQVKHDNRIKETMSLRVSKSTKEKLVALGKGYTSIVNRLIEYALDNPRLLQKCL